jgi:hypothetical protein
MIEMHKTIFYLKDFEIKELVLSQDYIDFNMREKFTRYDKFIEHELGKLISTDCLFWDYKDYCILAVCVRPYIIGSIKVDEILKRYIDNFGRLVDYPKPSCKGLGQYIADDLYYAANGSMTRTLMQLQNKGMKKKLKELHYHHSDAMVFQLLNDKIQHQEEQLKQTS